MFRSFQTDLGGCSRLSVPLWRCGWSVVALLVVGFAFPGMPPLNICATLVLTPQVDGLGPDGQGWRWVMVVPETRLVLAWAGT